MSGWWFRINRGWCYVRLSLVIRSCRHLLDLEAQSTRLLDARHLVSSGEEGEGLSLSLSSVGHTHYEFHKSAEMHSEIC